MFIDAKAEYIERLDETFRVDLANGMRLVVKRVLLTIGIVDDWPDIPGLDRCYGATAHVCPDCDGYDTRGKKTVVVASGRKAVGLALALTTWTQELIICTNGEPADLKEEWIQKLQILNIPVLETRIECARSIHGEVTGLDLEGGMSLDCEQLFFAIGQEAADDLGAQLGCERDEIGRIVIDQHHHTTVPNVYAAGDIIPGPQLAVVAAAGGTIAALAIHHSLLADVQRL
jgi:thioredoxin reductase